MFVFLCHGHIRCFSSDRFSATGVNRAMQLRMFKLPDWKLRSGQVILGVLKMTPWLTFACKAKVAL